MVHKLVQNRYPFIVLRGRTYYFRFAFPLHLRKLCPWLPAEVKRSLRTSSFSEAVALVEAKLSLIKLLKLSNDASQVESLYARLIDFSSQINEWVNKQYEALSGLLRTSDAASKASSKGKTLPSAPRLETVWQDFVKWRKWNKRRADQNQRVFDNLRFFLGNVPVNRIEKSHIKKALESISMLPVRNKKPYSKMTMKQLVRLDVPEEDLLSSKSVREHLKLAQGIFSSYLVREVDLLTNSPTEGVRWEVQNNRYASMTDAQVRKALRRSVDKPDWFQWFLKLAVYSGARRSEIAALEASDFRLCSDTNRHYFVIHKGKTKAAKRVVPIHPKLIEDGLLSWVGDSEGILFPIPNTTPNRVTENFASLLDEQVNDMGERIVFHSVRHTFITKARATALNTALIQQVVGHEKSGAGVTDRYTHTFQMKDVLPVIDVIDYGEGS